MIRYRLGAALIGVLTVALAVVGSGTAAAEAPTPDEVISDIDTAVAVTDAFWAETFPDSYTSPDVVGLYDGTRSGAPTCGGRALPPDNAVYCVSEDFLAWDVALMSRAFELGDSFLYMVVAHEWGHAIQARMSTDQKAVAGELQADCLAGASLYGAVAAGTLQFEQGDEKEITNGLAAVADEFAWGDPSHHGDPFQRIEAFNLGRTGGVGACIPGAAS